MLDICRNKRNNTECNGHNCDGCKGSILVYSKEEFREALKNKLISLRKEDTEELRILALSGHYSEIKGDLDSLYYTAFIIETYHRKLRWNQIFYGDSTLSRIKYILSPAVSKKEYMPYYNEYKDIINEVYNK